MSGTLRVKAALPKKPEPDDPPPAKPPVPRVAQLLALAHQIDDLIRRGEIKNLAEAARICGVTRARSTQIMNLMLLAPGIQELLVFEAYLCERRLRAACEVPMWRVQEEACSE